jgi:hypothetical protein
VEGVVHVQAPVNYIPRADAKTHLHHTATTRCVTIVAPVSFVCDIATMKSLGVPVGMNCRTEAENILARKHGRVVGGRDMRTRKRSLRKSTKMGLSEMLTQFAVLVKIH